MSTRVLLVDDEAAVRRQLSVAMTQEGYTTAEAPDGLSALQSIERQARQGQPFDVAVVDVVLPDIDGLKLLSIIKSRYPEMKVILISGYAGGTAEQEVDLRRGDGFMAKPFETKKLAELVDSFDWAEAPRPTAEVAMQTSAAAYVLVRVADGADPMAVYNALSYQNAVVYCDAVRDDQVDMVLLVHGRSHEELDIGVQAILDSRTDLASYEFIPVRPPYLSEEIRFYIEDYEKERAHVLEGGRTPHRATSYAIVEFNPPDAANLYTRLYFLDEVVEIDADVTGRRIVLLLQGSDFNHIRRVINQRIRMMDGVVRVRELKVVSFERF